MMPETPEILIYFRDKHCGYNKSCGMRISQCVVRHSLATHNIKVSEREQIQWCPRCDGVYFGLEKDVLCEYDHKRHDVERYTGGLLIVNGTQPKTLGYEFTLACECQSGQIRNQLQRALFYTLTDENRDWCYLQWRQVRVEIRHRQSKAQGPINPQLAGFIKKVLGDPVGIVERPKEPEIEPEADSDLEAPAESPENDIF